MTGRQTGGYRYEKWKSCSEFHAPWDRFWSSSDSGVVWRAIWPGPSTLFLFGFPECVCVVLETCSTSCSTIWLLWIVSRESIPTLYRDIYRLRTPGSPPQISSIPLRRFFFTCVHHDSSRDPCLHRIPLDTVYVSTIRDVY